MKKMYLLIILLLLSTQYVLANPNSSQPSWETIPVEKHFSINDDHGKKLTINPACAFDVLTDSQGKPTDNSFRFYFKQGKNDKLVVFFNGGGACWNDATCLTSLVKGPRPTYNPSISQENSPVAAGGIFDDNNEANPFKDWSKVFIPYCTGDIHIGSNTVNYTDDGSLTHVPGTSIAVQHHGFDNFLAVREWIKHRFSKKGSNLEKLLVTGSSAGGYGATLNFPYLQDAFPKTNAVLVSDGATATVTQGFIDTEFTTRRNWNLKSTLATATFGDNSLNFYRADTFNAALLDRLAASYPKSRFSQYTTEWDFVQVQFYKIMTKIDEGSTNPDEWVLSNTKKDYKGFFVPWNLQMENSLNNIAFNTVNYQYYNGAGPIHTAKLF